MLLTQRLMAILIPLLGRGHKLPIKLVAHGDDTADKKPASPSSRIRTPTLCALAGRNAVMTIRKKKKQEE
ncbi:hypothetical protein HBI52_134090 [Parastagonospora nodorum]|nr:hypothetical protein HBH50_162330 [Parastagonospora nodorum]KAH4084516.1 hypothetical protein HBH48_160060 [Parastagonospora nodorum]KAH4978158.1 hypothetical protein HBI76_213270 [Parastagonospora nodorum]KAH5356036.1 hypothetical protein HBI33_205350 [Parastagonospora nodorum]KAH5510836.1 hypothetical protein HBI52_134090 [Parastagonospora nodorum]